MIFNNIVDFVCLEKKVVVEVDGKYHDEQKEYDDARTNEIETLGFKVIRFTNEEVLANIDAVIKAIRDPAITWPTVCLFIFTLAQATNGTNKNMNNIHFPKNT